jgi:hypothetical protein
LTSHSSESNVIHRARVVSLNLSTFHHTHMNKTKNKTDYKALKIRYDNAIFERIELVSRNMKNEVQRTKPRGKADKVNRKYAVQAFSYINRIAREALNG